MHLRPIILLLVLAVAAAGLQSCGDDDAASSEPFTLATSPEFVNMVIPGHRPLALVTATSADVGTIRLSASTTFDGAAVEVTPSDVAPGEAAELWIDLPEVASEAPILVSVTGARGDEEHTVEIAATAMPGTDDLAPTATEIAAVFIAELTATVPELPTATSELVNGTPVAGLLVVTHYAWFTDEIEIGLAWHVMVAPDDWAELTLRPRRALAPTRAFRLSSWSTALAGGAVEITEIDPPPEVTR